LERGRRNWVPFLRDSRFFLVLPGTCVPGFPVARFAVGAPQNVRYSIIFGLNETA
jgi:hypothetical protein